MTHQPGNVHTVWVVEPRAPMLQEIVGLLHGLPITVRTYADARKAVLHARRAAPDLVVLGLEGGVIPTDELLVLARQHRGTALIPVIVVYEADADEALLDRVMALGATDALPRERLAQEMVRRVRWRLSQLPHKEVGSLQGARSFEFLERIIHASPHAIVAAHRSGEVVLFNRAAQRVLGWSEQDAMRLNVRQLYPPQGAERIMRMLRSPRYGGRGRMESVREQVISRDGEAIPVEISAALVTEGRREVATVGIFTDLRQRLEMEERLQQAFETLERTRRQAVIAELAGAAAHELNQPLTSLMGYTEFLQRHAHADDRTARALETIHQDARRISDVVRKIGRITNYKTKAYAGGEMIVDLDEAVSPESGSATRPRLSPGPETGEGA
ncbi:hypothetical protein DL240_03045 [Lujinxingia litoralis]|uniref:histidine kinase n=1 Tax=Lujinxingia litoralis TaxID=2211119 RepID=A0A328CD13_9DELT|nr:hybrid sensor histidine kinase/response regulator [Lujinxingia litoralis]RAL25201.1 hypothetical protein DL240_03045 [Lujinxingia litoralis]